MKIEIKHRFSDEVIFSHEQGDNSLLITVNKAVESRADLSDADLIGAYLRGANLSDANLSGADLSGALMIGADLSDADLSGALLIGANLSGADLSDANLIGADLSGALLIGADLSGALLSDADLIGALLRGANLSGATYGPATLEKGLLQLIGKYWPVYVFDGHIKIGCKLYTTKAWARFTDDQISQIDPLALEFWNENKALILSIANHHQNDIEEPQS